MTDPSNLAPSALFCLTFPRGRRTSQSYSSVCHLLRKNPHVWFAQVEAVFDLHRVTSETTRFRHLLCNLPPEVAGSGRRHRGSKQVFWRTTASESARLRHLLTHEELGDRRPSQLLNTMRQLVGASNVDSNAAAGDLTLDRAAELADKVHDATSPSVTPLASTAESSAVSRLETRIDQLAASIEALRTSSDRRCGSSPRPSRRSSSPGGSCSRSPRSSAICWYSWNRL
ncbi:hypothetical protein HPB48_021091 [Haemaphysalis longicornis]|uniref:DUF7041 domain-containing protein n=1 Tax=Haemaphysalis longicornis TaxID=44386 RepID=A0A9J6GIS3_HAELO|nr:hypothetical protein HPB48_021091 [Haemaphysalis longicornis]